MKFYASGAQLRVDLKTLKTKEIQVDGVVCKKVGNSVHSYHCLDLYGPAPKCVKLAEKGSVEQDVIYLPRDTSPKAVALLPYILEQYGKGLQLYNIGLVDLLNLKGWEHHMDTNCCGVTQVRTSNKYFGSENIFGWDLFKRFSYCKVGEMDQAPILVDWLSHSRGHLTDLGKRDTLVAAEVLKQLPVKW